ncbi:MAG: hypothetical protein JNN28_14725, partial [Saprospiraceae bacterium]|nr:hypothetical protein [Saprospiraceae bacterium]
MKTIILLLAGFLCLIQTAGAQNHPANDLVFSTADTSDGYLRPRRMIQTSDGGFLVAGKFFDQGYITKIQSCGTQVWMRTYAFGDETELLSLVELPSGEIAAVGSCDNCAPNDSTLKALVIKTDQNGLLLADTTLGNLNLSALATDILLNEDQQLAVTGYLTIGPGFLPSNAFMAIMAPESLQTPDWNTYHQLFYDYSNAITQTQEGNYVLAGRSSPALFSPVQAQVYCTDAAGNLLWSHASPYQNSQFNDVTQAADGRIVALGDRLVDANVGRELFMLVLEKETGAVLQEITLGSEDDDAGKSIQSVENGFLIGAIYGMPRQQDWNRRDWVLRLDTQFNMVDQYFRDDYLLAHSMVNALPLSPDGRWFVYYAQVSFFTANQILFYKHTDQGYRTLLENAPSNHQLTPRNLQTNKGDIRIKGAVAPDQYDALRLDIFRNHQLFQTFLDDTPQNFDFQQQMEAELAEYTYRLTGVKGSINTLELEACDLVAGDVYLIQGQSNAVAGLPLQDADHAYRHHTSPYIRNFGLKFKNDTLFTWKKEETGWLDFNDNIVGQWGILMAKNIVDQHQIPVAVINGAVSGIAIDSLSPPNSRYQ